MLILFHYSIVSLWVTGHHLPHVPSHDFDAAYLFVLGSSAVHFYDDSDTKGTMSLVLLTICPSHGSLKGTRLILLLG